MAFNKNQHFVPKAHLRPFTHSREGRAINLLHVPSRKAVFGAPVRNQCSGDYFYGQNAALEDAIQTVEGAYAKCVASLQAAPNSVSDLQEIQLKRFIYLQHVRTESSARHVAEYSSAITAMDPGIVPPPNTKELIKTGIIAAMRNYAESMDMVDDLRLRVLRNDTSVPFVTSDDPAVLLNRWHQARPQNRNISFGVGSAGAVMFMPLTPELAVVLFDGDIYSMEHSHFVTRIGRRSDIQALNAIQALNCNMNLYFDDVGGAEHAQAAARLAEPHRPGKRLEVYYAVQAHTDGEFTRYDVTDTPDFNGHDNMLVHTLTMRTAPPAWPSVMRLKHRRSAYIDASGRYLREAIAARSGGQWRKVVL
ncbi:DUF4238 domain-containing protein [Devosia sp.]|uniref:DUF4238 domain-containing protein n=1 Tax=Devosia sp. TaxID=1871048 RepID=UPI0019EB0572|nr:DUF4238 domain-containing protein [Devosia sp.]MBE0580030.1 DUF4238 domain-containing protein [Devosia sp.]